MQPDELHSKKTGRVAPDHHSQMKVKITTTNCISSTFHKNNIWSKKLFKTNRSLWCSVKSWIFSSIPTWMNSLLQVCYNRHLKLCPSLRTDDCDGVTLTPAEPQRTSHTCLSLQVYSTWPGDSSVCVEQVERLNTSSSHYFFTHVVIVWESPYCITSLKSVAQLSVPS